MHLCYFMKKDVRNHFDHLATSQVFLPKNSKEFLRISLVSQNSS